MSEKIEQSRARQHKSYGLELPVEPRDNQIKVLLLQHPQEPDKLLGSAVLCSRTLENSRLRIGLSWPSLSKAWGQELRGSQWGVLYLGAQKDLSKIPTGQSVAILDKKSQPMPISPALEGIVVLDGTWSQAKALWWRNSWLLKLHRIVLKPHQVSRYGRLRKEPRREAVSTIESVALCLRALGESEITCSYLEQSFVRMLDQYKSERSRPIPPKPQS